MKNTMISKVQNDRPSQVVILAGGRGERLRPLTDSIPKPMAPINGRPFLDYLLTALADAGFSEAVFLLGYRGEVIKERYKKNFGIQTIFSFGSTADQTGRRLTNAHPLLDERFLLVYGDNYWPLDVQAMWAQYCTIGAAVQTTVFANLEGTGEYGFQNNVLVDAGNRVRLYDKSRRNNHCNGVDIGFFIVDKRVVSPEKKDNWSFEEDLLPELISKGELSAYVTQKQYYYITDISALKHFENVVINENRLNLNMEPFLG
jgi:NDP-sugar pyrophosphorylase family protein